MAVFVLSKSKKPLMPCSEKRARQLLERGRAVVHRLHPFTIRLKDRADGDVQDIELRVDPGSKSSGVALVRKGVDADTLLHLAQIDHRGARISERLSQRASFRRRRRSQNLRYRAPRFNNRTRPKGWLPPSIQHRVDADVAYVKRLQKLAPITHLAQELVGFNMQALENPEISGVEYQQGTLAGYEVREYFLEKWQRCCAYCGIKDVPHQIDHIHPRVRGGSNRVPNLTLACQVCNQSKGAMPVEEFLAKKPQVLAKIKAQSKRPLKDAAAVNATRWALRSALEAATGLPVAVATGGRTKWNRTRAGLPKTHALDAACVGDIGAIKGWNVPVLQVRSMGRGSHQRTRLDKYGFPRGYLKGGKTAFGFQTGDIVRAIVPKGKKAGVLMGRVAIRSTGSFNIQTATGVVQGISHRHCTILQRNDGYGYNIMEKPVKLPKKIEIAVRDQDTAPSHLPSQSSGLEGVSLKGRIWRQNSYEPEVVRALSDRGLDRNIAEVLAGRGVTSDQLEDFLTPKIRNLFPDPSRFKDMDKSISFLCDKISAGVSLGIWSDYDCDGVTSAAILGRFFKMIGLGDIDIRIPDRMTEGYGPNTKGLLAMKSDGIDTVCILDSGIVAFEPLKEAKSAGLNVIVIDHHMAEPDIPEAIGVVNANRLDEEPGFEHLCAAGMTFIFCVGVARELKKRGWFDGKEGRPPAIPNVMRLLGIVALGTVADVVPLLTINRAFVMRGLEEINAGSFPGLSALREVAGLSKYDPVTSKDLGWKFGPRINAAGRIEDAMLGVKLLLEDDPAKALEQAQHLDAINARRKSVEERVTEAALAQFADRIPGQDRRVAIAVVEDAHEGVVGISAGRLREACDCPAIVLTLDHEGLLKGSARSVPGFDIGHAIIDARKSGLIERGGGHGMAGGLTLRDDQLAAFEAFMNAEIEKSDYFRDGVTSDYDIALSPDRLTASLIESMSQMEPYGRDNPNPVVLLSNAKITGTRVLKEKHLKLTVSASGKSVDVLMWNVVGSKTEEFLQAHRDTPLDFLGEPGINEWRGNKTVQMIAEDVRVS